MKTIKSLYELRKEDPYLMEYFKRKLLEGGVLEEELDIPFIDTVGGNVHIITTPSEIDNIPALSDHEDFIPSQEYYEIVIITNDAGGDTYFIPESLYEKYLFYNLLTQKRRAYRDQALKLDPYNYVGIV